MMRARDMAGAVHEAIAINDVSLLRQKPTRPPSCAS